ncbi:MAG: NYN domain-containing protein [Candidatus Limnocylindria bacterium]
MPEEQSINTSRRPAAPAPALRTVVFIDGQNMYKGAREAFGYEHEKGHFGNFRPLALARLLTQEPHRDLRQVRFYMGVPDPRRQRRGHAMAQRRLASWQSDHPGLVHIFTRTLRYPPPEGREKGVDVQLAVDLVTLAIDDEYDLAVLASADTDLLPALDFVVQRHPLKLVECVGWEPIPGCEDRTAAPLDSRSKGVIRRTVLKEDFERVADRQNHMLSPTPAVTPRTLGAFPGQSGRQLPKRRDS